VTSPSARFTLVPLVLLAALATGCPAAPEDPADPDAGAPADPGDVVFTSSPITAATEDTPYVYDTSAESPDEPIAISATTLPGWMQLEGTTLAGTPVNEDVGTHDVVLVATDAAGEAASQAFTVTVANTNDAPVISGAPGTTAEVGLAYSFAPQAVDVDVGDALEFTITNSPSWAALNAATGALTGTPSVGDIGITTSIVITVTDADSATASLPAFDLEVVSETPLPPDPADIASDRPRDRATTTYDANRFLIDHDPPVQRDVDPGALVAERASLIRGRVLGADGEPLSRVRVAFKGKPGLGYTLSRADGGYDLLVNGGASPTLTFHKPAHLSAQRTVRVGWQGTLTLDDIVLIPRDPIAGVIDLDDTSTPLQIARAGPVSDDRGVRAATLAFRAGTSAEAELDDGTRVPLDSLTVRATEYTVGVDGPARMPGDLPRGIAYTYAVDLSVDEAEVAGAHTVHFDIPVVQYVDDFLGFPAGAPVPVFAYDTALGAWLRLEDGLVIEVLSTSGGVADVDIDGSGIAASETDLIALGIDAAERALLAADYAAGSRLWRSELPHFSPVDYNWPRVFPDDAEDPVAPDPFEFIDPPDFPCAASGGSTLLCEDQVLLETFPLVGAGASLVYSSERTPGFTASTELTLPLTGPEIPASLIDVRLVIDVAGQHSVDVFPPSANLVRRVTWDGHDGYGRPVQGRAAMRILIGFTYPFAYACGQAICPQAVATRWARFTRQVGTWDARGYGLGGLSLSTHHALDVSNGLVRKGDGTRLAGAASSAVVEDVTDEAIISDLDYVRADVTVAPDGSIYVADHGNDTVWRIEDGVMTALNDRHTDTPDSDRLAEMFLDEPFDVAFGNDGDFYILENRGNQRVLHVDRAGQVRTILTNASDVVDGQYWYEIYETQERMRVETTWTNGPNAAAVGRDGTLYLADNGATVLEVSPDGWLRIIAGSTSYCGGYCGDDGPAKDAEFSYIFGMEVDDQGGLYLADADNGLRYISPDGIITRLASGRQVSDVALAADGSVYFTERTRNQVKLLSVDGTARVVVGDGTTGTNDPFSGTSDPFDGQPALSAGINEPNGLAAHPDGSLIILHGNDDPRVTRVRSATPGFSASDILIPDRAAGALLIFTGDGRHLETLDLKTGALLRSFAYDTEGRLSDVTDAFGGHLSIDRPDASTVLLTEPGGRVTTLTLDGEGYASVITSPGGDEHGLTHDTTGLLTRVDWPSGRTSTATFDSTSGRLLPDDSRSGRAQSMTRDEDPAAASTTVTRTDARTGTHVYASSIGEEGAVSRTVDSACCGVNVRTFLPYGTVELQRADGTLVTIERGPDPRFGMLDPVPTSMTFDYPDGTTRSLAATRTANLDADGALLSLDETLVVNAATWTRTFDVVSGVEVTTSPAGRVDTSTYAGSFLSLRQRGDLAPEVRGYDAAGRVTSLAFGQAGDAPTWRFAYDTTGRPASITSPVAGVLSFELNDEDRVTGLVLPDGRRYGQDRNADGQLTAAVAPDGTSWAITRDALGRVSAVVPPTVAGDDTLSYARDAAGHATALSWTDGVTVGLAYDGAGRLTSVTEPGLTLTAAYDADSGKQTTLNASDGSNLTLAYAGPRLVSQTWSGAVNASTETVFDGVGRVTSETVNAGAAIARAYDEDGLLTSAGPVTLTRGASRGDVEAIAVGSVVEAREYDGEGRLIRQSVAVDATPLFALEYVRDALGRVVEEIETRGASTSRTFAYDTAGRLVGVTTGAGTTSYGYDVRDNRTSVDDGIAVASTFDAQDRPLTAGIADFTHDRRGARLTRSAVAAVTSTTHDALGRALSVELPGGSVVTYAVDPLGRRVEKRIDGAHVSSFVYRDGGVVAAELDEAGVIRSRFVYASARDVPDAMIVGADTFRIVRDQNGSVRMVVNAATGAVVQSLRYDAWGRVLEDTAPGLQPFGFAGGLSDVDTGLVRFGARDYDPALGRWVTRDPALFASIAPNLYAYVANDPVNFRDPSGRFLPLIPPAVVLAAPTIAALGAELVDFAIAVGNSTGLLPLDGAASFGSGVGNLAGTVAGNAVREAISHHEATQQALADLEAMLESATGTSAELEALLDELDALLNDC